MTPKEKVLKHFPLAYCVQYELLACVYSEPLKVLPRGQLTPPAVVIGVAPRPREAWADACSRTRFTRGERV